MGPRCLPQRIFEPTPSKTSEDTPLRNRMYLNFISDVHANTRRRCRTFNMFSSDFEDMDQKKETVTLTSPFDVSWTHA